MLDSPQTVFGLPLVVTSDLLGDRFYVGPSKVYVDVRGYVSLCRGFIRDFADPRDAAFADELFDAIQRRDVRGDGSNE